MPAVMLRAGRDRDVLAVPDSVVLLDLECDEHGPHGGPAAGLIVRRPIGCNGQVADVSSGRTRNDDIADLQLGARLDAVRGSADAMPRRKRQFIGQSNEHGHATQPFVDGTG